MIVKKPGGQNDLGSFKFIFPNAYNVYFQGTPAKMLFKDEARAFSHSCIRFAK